MNQKFQELAFDVVIPSHLIVNPNLEPNAKLFYGLVRNLTKLEGYCYASNQYLADMMEVDKRTVQRWIESLEENNYIEIFDREGFESKRKIFISNKFLQRDISVTPPVTNVSPPHDKNAIHKENSLKEDRLNTVCPAPPVGVLGPSKIEKISTDGKKEIFEKDEIFRKAIAERKEWKTSHIEEAWNILVNYSGRVNNAWRFIEGTIEKLQTKQNFEKMKVKEEKQECKQPTLTGRVGRAPTAEDIAMIKPHSAILDYLKGIN